MFTSLQTRLKRASRWLPALLLPFAAQAQSLNYAPAGATNIVTTFTNVSATGTAIATANTDDANSTAQPIGFTFNFNGAAFTQFVLNTNGFLKLGATAPSATSLYYQAETTFGGDALSSTDAADINIIAPFNVNLESGTAAGGATYQVTTTGTSPNRVCTVQWTNVRDKAITSSPQYDSFTFQARLFEGSNNIDFVYGPTVAGVTGTDIFRLGAAGIKGGGAATGQTVLVNKTASGSAWSTAVFIAGPYTGSALNYRRNFAPDLGRTFHFTPTVLLNNDAAVTALYTLGKVSSSFGSPVTAQVVVTNAGSAVQTSLPVTLAVSGATTYTSTQTVASLASGASTTLTFTYPVTGTTGTNTVLASVPNTDDLATNNSKTYSQTVTAGNLAYVESSQPLFATGVGVGSANGVLAARYTVAQATVVSSITATFVGAGTANTTYQVLLYNAAGTGSTPGAVLFTSSTLTRPGASGPVTVPVPNIAVPAGDFFVAIKELDNNIGLAYQVEDPLRLATFYFQAPPGGFTLVNTTALRTRLALEVGLGAVACAPVSGLAVGSITTTGASVTFTGPSNGTTYTVTYTPTAGTATTVTPAPTGSPVVLTGLTAGTTYTVSVTSNCGPGQTSTAATTTFTTLAVAPANDLCSAAIVLTCGQTVTGTTVGATSTGDPTATCNAGSPLAPSASPGVFYSFAGNGQIATVSTCSGPTATAGDTKVFVYSGSCGTLTCVGSSDDIGTGAGGCGTNGTASIVTFPTVTGTTYYIFVQFFGTATGPFGLNVTCTAPVVTTYATLPVSESFEGPWVNGLGTRDLPTASWRNTPATGNTSMRRDDDGASAGWSFLTSGAYTPAFSQGARSARFHSYGAANRAQGTLDLYVNMTTAGSKRLTFDYINPTGTDSLRIFVSTNGGTTFTGPLRELGLSPAFASIPVVINSTSATTVIRFLAQSDFGNDDLGFDNVRVAIITGTRNEALAATVSLYPNPANRAFTLDVPAGALRTATATLHNALGQTVQTRQLSAAGSTTFDVSGLAAGVYSLELKAGDTLVVKRVVVE